MISKTISGGVLALALLSAPAANAAVINWGAHDATETNFSRSLLYTNFTNTFNFSLSSLSDLVASFSLTGLGSATVSLRDGSGSVLGSFSTQSSGSASFSNLAAGNYSYSVTGGSWFGAGTFTSTLTPVSVSPVPEPGSLAMLLAGLGMVGFMARRRRA